MENLEQMESYTEESYPKAANLSCHYAGAERYWSSKSVSSGHRMSHIEYYNQPAENSQKANL